VSYTALMGLPSDAPPAHGQLVRDLAELPESERRAVIAAARKAAAEPRRQAVVSWQSIRAAMGVVKGEPADAVEDCARLYDG
jgi:hypothetical protein